MQAQLPYSESVLAVNAVQEAIVRLEKRAQEIRSMVYADPGAEIVELRKEVDKKIAEQGYMASMEFVAASIAKERELLWLMKQQKRKTPQLVLELIGVDMQIDDLKKELSSLTYPSIICR